MVTLENVGDYYIVVRHNADSYYTQAETIATNMKLYANVTPQTTHNKTVNITAKSNIFSEVMPGKLLFIFPNGENITANYAGNGTWWTLYPFDDYGDYLVNASYEGLGNVAINNGTISISKTPTNITVENTTVDLFVLDSVGTGAALTPAEAGNLTFISSDSSVVKVEDGKIIAVGAGTAIITVSFTGSDDYVAAENKTITVNVIKYDSKVTISPIDDVVYPSNVTIKYCVENRTNITVSIDGVSSDKIIITNDTITVVGLDAGKYTITILNNESGLYYKSSDTKSFSVNKIATSIVAADVSTTYDINKDLVITLKDSTGKALSGVKVTVDLNGAKTYSTDKNGQVKVSTKGLAAKTYNAKITFNGNAMYDKSSKNVKVTVKKAANPLKVKAKTVKVKFSKLKKKAVKFKVTKVVKFTKKGQGTLTYKKVKGNKKIKINKKTGKVTIKKGLKKGTYKVKMKIKAKGNANYKPSAFKTITFKIKCQ